MVKKLIILMLAVVIVLFGITLSGSKKKSGDRNSEFIYN